MNSVHDMGGMDGFGAVEWEPNEPPFHHEWEQRMAAIASLVFWGRLANVDEFRHAIERIAPAAYLASSYYERWMRAAEGALAEKGISGAKSELIPTAPNSIASRKKARARAKFKVGDV